MLKNIIKKIPGARQLAMLLGFIPKPIFTRKFLLEMLPKNSIGAEIGVHLGDFSKKLWHGLSPKELHLIDPWEYHSSETYKTAWYGGGAKGGQKEMDERHEHVCNLFKKQIQENMVKIHRGYSADVLEQFPDGYFDWIYVDGNHSYDGVKKDLEVSFRKTKVGGLIVGDDYHDRGWWGDGIYKAVDEFSLNKKVELIKIENEQFIFRKNIN